MRFVCNNAYAFAVVIRWFQLQSIDYSYACRNKQFSAQACSYMVGSKNCLQIIRGGKATLTQHKEKANGVTCIAHESQKTAMGWHETQLQPSLMQEHQDLPLRRYILCRMLILEERRRNEALSRCRMFLARGTRQSCRGWCVDAVISSCCADQISNKHDQTCSFTDT